MGRFQRLPPRTQSRTRRTRYLHRLTLPMITTGLCILGGILIGILIESYRNSGL